jgi:hypothetical protein
METKGSSTGSGLGPGQGAEVGFNEGDNMKRISEEDLKWLVESTIEVMFIQGSEYGNDPALKDVERIMQIAESNGIELTKYNYGDWIKEQKRKYT